MAKDSRHGCGPEETPTTEDVNALERIERAIEPSVASMGFEIVRVRLTGGRQRPTLQVMAERRDGEPMSVDDCAQLSRTISTFLDVEDPLPGSYMLEVSSPGLDRPLVRRQHFERFAGHEARIELTRPLDGRRRFRGRIMGVEGEDVRVVVEGQEVKLPLEAIGSAKLVLTDELLSAAQRRERT
ncbi:MAG: ribosome maturation factor RimP [Alphaproteobacteria bacterium]